MPDRFHGRANGTATEPDIVAIGMTDVVVANLLVLGLGKETGQLELDGQKGDEEQLIGQARRNQIKGGPAQPRGVGRLMNGRQSLIFGCGEHVGGGFPSFICR